MTRRLAPAVVALGLAACAPRAPAVTAAHATWASTRWPGVTLAELDLGRTIYVRKCSGCHLPPAPSSHSPESWPGHIAEMRERSKLAPEEVVLVEHYVITVASAR